MEHGKIQLQLLPPLSSLECALTKLRPFSPKNVPVTPLNSALTDTPGRKSFRIRTYKNRGEGSSSCSAGRSPRGAAAFSCADVLLTPVRPAATWFRPQLGTS